ncbi:unnamed protein product [Vicia faba]|uniref:Uncharacterized protein n=1 Tax=Vicia faba TaxID=3906 RepID=A0AAV1ADE6_VICFA|nr:unnamed protein product [Vicia faba]
MSFFVLAIITSGRVNPRRNSFVPFLKGEDIDFEQKGNLEYKPRRKTAISGIPSTEVANAKRKKSYFHHSNSNKVNRTQVKLSRVLFFPTASKPEADTWGSLEGRVAGIHFGNPHRSRAIGRLLRRKSSAEDSQRDTDKAKNKIRIRVLLPRKNGMILATFYSLMPMLTLIALNTILSLGIAGKIRSMKTMGQGSGYLVKPAPVFNLGIKYLKKILPEKLERVEQKSFQSQQFKELDFFHALLSKVGFSLGGRALSFALRGLGCSAGLALTVDFTLRALLTYQNHMMPLGEGTSGSESPASQSDSPCLLGNGFVRISTTIRLVPWERHRCGGRKSHAG